jgi:hypothetical protein
MDELKIGEEVKVYERGIQGNPGGAEIRAGYRIVCTGVIADLKPDYILIDRGYKARYDIVEFRTRRYRLLKTCGVEVKFDPLPDKAKLDEILKKKAHEEYINSHAGKGDKACIERKKAGNTITWEKVSALLDQGMSPGQAADELKTTNWIVKGLITKHEKMKREVEEKMSQAKITREQLYNYVKKNGTAKAALQVFADQVDMKVSTLSFYLTEWGINKQLRDEGLVTVFSQRRTVKSEQKITQEPDTTETTKEIISGNNVVMEDNAKIGCGENGQNNEEADLAQIEEQDQLAEDRQSLRGMNNIEKALVETAKEVAATMNDNEAYICAYKGCTTLINSGAFCEKHNNVNSLPAMIRRRPILRPVNMMGEATGRSYIFVDNGFKIAGEATYHFDDIDGLIEELQAIKEMRSA